MKTTIKLLMVVSLFCGVVFADGNQGSGGRDCPPEGCPPPCTVNCGGNVATWNEDESTFDSPYYVGEITDVIEQSWLLAL